MIVQRSGWSKERGKEELAAVSQGSQYLIISWTFVLTSTTLIFVFRICMTFSLIKANNVYSEVRTNENGERTKEGQ